MKIKDLHVPQKNKMKEKVAAPYVVENETMITEVEKIVLEQAAKIYKRLAIQGDALTNPEAVKNWVKAELRGNLSEVFAVLWLDNRHHVISFEKLFYGTIDGVSVYPREIVRSAIHHNAAACILAHNHPSGDATPSREDLVLNTSIKEALDTVSIRLLDHLIIGDITTSLAELGKI